MGSWIGMGRLLPSLVLYLLLLMSGVEPNPGPLFNCKLCPGVFHSCEAIFNHLKDCHLPVPCPFDGCSFSTVSLDASKVHYSRNHPSMTSVAFKCPMPACAIPVNQSQGFKDHLEEHLDLGHSFKCPYSASCKTVHQKKNNFRVHVSQVHRSELIEISEPQVPSSSGQDKDNSTLIGHEGTMAANLMKDAVVKFYLELEGLKVLPSLTVQFICERVALFTEMSHKCLQETLRSSLVAAGLNRTNIEALLQKTFSSDPVFNVHHKHHEPDQVSSIYFRKEELKKKFAFEESIQIQLPRSAQEKPKSAQYVPIRKTLETILKDPKAEREVLKSFARSGKEGILEDFRDGIAFKNHLAENNNHKCIPLVFFMDAFEYSPFGPAKGLYKTLGMSYFIGSLSPEYRSKVENIFLAFLIREAHLKQTEEEYLNGTNKFEEAFSQLFKDLTDLKENGILINAETYPVCFLFCSGDNLGAHQIGSYSQSFSAEYCCRYCPMSMTEFQAEPFKCKPLRSPQQYDQSVLLAKESWTYMKQRAIALHDRKKEIQAQKILAGEVVLKKVSDTKVSKNFLKKLQAVNHEGVKPFPSALNKIPGFHVSDNGLPPCLAHDLFEGVVDLVLAKVLEHFVKTKKWFTMETLNRRIVNFKYKGKDADDSPSALSSFDAVKGHAVETWTLLRLLPLLIGDLFQDSEDEFWVLYLKLSELCQFICAPKVTVKQEAYLQTLIESYLLDIKQLLPHCLTPKHHFLAHYPALICVYGPLIRLWTMRFESKHVFFKSVAKNCKSFKNILFTLAQKYQFRFVLDHMNGLIPPDLMYDSTPEVVCMNRWPADVRSCLPPDCDTSQMKNVDRIVIKGTDYKVNHWMILDKVEPVDILVGCIENILVFPNQDIKFVLRTYVANKDPNGLYLIGSSVGVQITRVLDLPDYFPLPIYPFGGKFCLSLKHSLVFMQS